jgi:serine/threonine-protein kinase
VERALVLKQSYLSPHNQHAQLLGRLGRSRQAIAAAQTATDLDPLNGVYWLHLARAHIGAGNLDLARAALIRCMEINPGMGRSDMGLVDLLSGSPESALVVYEGIPSLKGVALAKHDLGRAKESQRALDDLIARHGSTSPCAVAEVYAWRGERDKAFEWLQRAYDQRDLALASVKANPLLRNLHDDPRWKPFLRKMNLPVD